MEKQNEYINHKSDIQLNGNNLLIDDVYNVAYKNKSVSLTQNSINKIKICREMVEKKISQGEVVYGDQVAQILC